MFKKLLIALVIGVGIFGVAASQYQSPLVAQGNPQCPTRPSGDSSNACASTAFVQAAVGGVINTLCTLLPNTCINIFGYANIVWFGAIGNSGATDNGPLLRLTQAAALSVGAPIYIGPSSGYYGVSTCVNNAVFDMSGTNGNKRLSIFGGGWNEKPFATPSGSWLLPNSSFPATCSWIRYSGTDKVSGVTFKDFGIGEFGGSLGTPKGLHGIFIDASNPAFYLQNLVMDHVYIGNMAVGNSFKCTTSSAATPGCMPDSTIINSKFMSFNADFLADHVTLDKNTIGQNATVDARNIGIEFAQCSGCTSTNISQNNISNFNGMVVIHGSNKTVIRDNEMEMSAGFTNTRGAMIDLVGDVATVEAYTITGNQLAQQSLVGDYAPIKAAAAVGQIYDNRIGLAKATPYDYVTITGAALGTKVDYNDCSYANATSTVRDLACTISSLGPIGFQYTPFGFSLPGSTSGRATIGTQAVTGTPALLFPTVSGTFISALSSPLVLNINGTGSCPTCATTAGANIPSVATGDLLYGSATNVLSTLADVATGNALISGGVGVAPLWGKIGNSTLTNSSTTVNGQTCTLGSTCTVTASATSITVASTTVGSGTSHGVLTNNVGVLGNTAAGTNGQLFLGVNSAEPAFATMSSDATITNAGVLTISANAVINAKLATMVTNTVKGNATSGTASPTDLAVGTCSTAASALIWTTNTGFGCNTSITASSATTATNATNGATVATSTNASFFPLFAASSTNSNQPFNLDTTFTYNPSTDTLTATNFAGNATTATTATTGTNATNTAITDDTTTNATVYPTWVTTTTGNLPQKTSSSKLTFNPSTGVLSPMALSMAAGSGAFSAGSAATSGQLTTMLLNGGSTGGSYMAWQAGNVTYAYIGDDRSILGAANDNLLIQSQSGDGMHFQTNGANTDRFAITSAGVISMPTLGSDTATVDNTVCVSAAGVILKGSGALGVCLGTSSARYKHDIVSMGAGLAEIVKLTPKNFFYNKGYGDDGYRLQYGFVAEDVIKILPQLVGLDKEKKASSVDMLAMVPIMVSAIKQLKVANDNLEARLVKLEARK